MARGKRIDDKKRELIKAHYMAHGNKSATAREYNVSVSTVHSIIEENKDEVEEVRKHKKEQWIEDAWNTINLYIQHVQDPEVIQKTGARDSAILIGTLHDKMIKNKELDLKREELDLKRKEVEEPQDQRVVIINDKEAMRKELENEND